MFWFVSYIPLIIIYHIFAIRVFPLTLKWHKCSLRTPNTQTIYFPRLIWTSVHSFKEQLSDVFQWKSIRTVTFVFNTILHVMPTFYETWSLSLSVILSFPPALCIVAFFYLFLQFETHRQRLLSSSPENLEQVSFFVFHTLFSYVMVFDYYLLSLVADLFGLFKYVD